MKKNTYYTLAFLFLFLFPFCLTAQRNCSKIREIELSSKNKIKGPTDTLQAVSFQTGTPTLYKYVEGGYTFGVNQLGDLAYAQKYKVSISYMVDGVALWVGAKNQVGTADTLKVILYLLNGPGTDTLGPVSNAPDTSYAIAKIPVNQIDTNELTVVMFSKPIYVSSSYALGVDFSLMGNDTIGLVTTKDGDALKTQLSWNQWSDKTWHTVLEPLNWKMDIDLGIFAIVDMTSANIIENDFVNGLKMSVCQIDLNGNTSVAYEIKEEGDVSLEIYDISGKLLNVFHEGRKPAGKFNITINNQSQSGVYLYSLKSGSHRLTKKVVHSK